VRGVALADLSEGWPRCAIISPILDHLLEQALRNMLQTYHNARPLGKSKFRQSFWTA
jgi:hypothetical protein